MLKPVFQRILPVMFLLLVCQGLLVRGQDAAPTLTLANELKIGVDCPVATAAQPGTDTVWVLMYSCYGPTFTLVAYDMKTGDLLNQPPITVGSADDPDIYATWYANALGFLPDGQLELAANDVLTFDLRRVQIDIATGTVTSDADADAKLNAALAGVTTYKEATIYSPNHAFGAATDEAKLYVLDMNTGDLLFDLEANLGFVSFAPDSSRMFVAVFDDPDNFAKTSGTLSVYSLPDGEQLSSLHPDVISSSVMPSPDGRYAALLTGDNQLSILDLSTGVLSPLLNVLEEPQRVTKCANDGRDMSDYDYRTSGNLFITGLNWLSDSSGFVTFNTNNGEATSDNCVLDFSRLRQYSVSG